MNIGNIIAWILIVIFSSLKDDDVVIKDTGVTSSTAVEQFNDIELIYDDSDYEFRSGE